MMRVLLLAALLPASAFAYDETVHAFITRHALPLDRPVAPPTQDDLDTFRAQFWVRASEHAKFVADRSIYDVIGDLRPMWERGQVMG